MNTEAGFILNHSTLSNTLVIMGGELRQTVARNGDGGGSYQHPHQNILFLVSL